jgi:hypothetical protein
MMDNKKISGLAVVEDSGKLVGNTSASDLKVRNSIFLKMESFIPAFHEYPLDDSLEKSDFPIPENNSSAR